MKWCLIVSVTLWSSLLSQAAILRRSPQVLRAFPSPNPGPRNARQTDLYPSYSESGQSYASPASDAYTQQYYAPQPSASTYPNLNDYFANSYTSYAPQQKATYVPQPYTSYSSSSPYITTTTSAVAPTYSSSYAQISSLPYLSPVTTSTYSEEYEAPAAYPAASNSKSQYVTKLSSAADAYRSIADCLHSKLQSAYPSADKSESEYQAPVYGRNANVDVSYPATSGYVAPAPYTPTADASYTPTAAYTPTVDTSYTPTVDTSYTPTVDVKYTPTADASYTPAVGASYSGSSPLDGLTKGLPLKDLLKVLGRAKIEEIDVVAEGNQVGVVDVIVDDSGNKNNLQGTLLSDDTTVAQANARAELVDAFVKKFQAGIVNVAGENGGNNNNLDLTVLSTDTNTVQAQNGRGNNDDDFANLLKLVSNHFGGNKHNGQESKKRDEFEQLLALLVAHSQFGLANFNGQNLFNNNNLGLNLFGHKTNTFQNQHQQQLKEFRAKQIEKELIDLLLVGNQVGGANGAFDNIANNNNLAANIFSSGANTNQFQSQHHSLFKGRAEGGHGGEGHHGGMHGRAIADSANQYATSQNDAGYQASSPSGNYAASSPSSDYVQKY
ncbi:uncharacterized protein LOC110851402 isoform X2 [Folsomia candida]|uniref:uncharacterized protein LOC110851402 isoform X2 n=1 Tax=Folsomia candida TaxID=158441 RepID=UPI000B9027A6|nr:uncharacterized protein LOC110851402 isoform X2 [Folsomia candida]